MEGYRVADEESLSDRRHITFKLVLARKELKWKRNVRQTTWYPSLKERRRVARKLFNRAMKKINSQD